MENLEDITEIYRDNRDSQGTYELVPEVLEAVVKHEFAQEMLSPGAPGYGDPIFSPILHARMRSALVSLGQPPGTSCEGVAHLCSRLGAWVTIVPRCHREWLFSFAGHVCTLSTHG